METAFVIAIVIGLTQVFKMFGFNDRFTPFFAIVAGIGVTFVSTAGGVGEQVLWGIVAGLSAMGLWSGSKTVITGQTSNNS